MTRLDDATDRLTRAIDRIERALENGGSGEAVSADQVEALREGLEQARRENASLRQISEAVVARLDEAISQLQSVLET